MYYAYSTCKERIREWSIFSLYVYTFISGSIKWQETRENTKVFTGIDLANNIF